jgi:isocitrate dehydrogenase
LKLNIPADGVKIGHDGKRLVVPDNPIIPYIIGDGIGIDVTPVMKRVLDYAVNKAYGNHREIK